MIHLSVSEATSIIFLASVILFIASLVCNAAAGPPKKFRIVKISPGRFQVEYLGWFSVFPAWFSYKNDFPDFKTAEDFALDKCAQLQTLPPITVAHYSEIDGIGRELPPHSYQLPDQFPCK